MDVLSFLAPALPTLIIGGTKAIEKVGETIGESAAKKVLDWWGRLWGKMDDDGKEAARGAAFGDKEAIRELAAQLEKVLKENPDLAGEIAEIMQQAQPASGGVHQSIQVGGSVGGSITQAGRDVNVGDKIVGDRNVKIGGNFSGGDIITGDRNKK